MSVKVTNNAWGTLSVGVNDTDTTLLLNTAQGDRFPSLPPSLAGDNEDYFYVTLVSDTNEVEIVRVIERINDVLTVVRAQDGTRRKQFLAGSRVELRPVAAVFNSKLDSLDYEKDKESIEKKVDELKGQSTDLFDRALHIDPQDLTDKEKEQVRKNINVPTLDGTGVSFTSSGIQLAKSDNGDSQSIKGEMSANDWWRVTGLNKNGNGQLEFATSTGGDESAVIRQYKGNFTTVFREAQLLNKDGNTQFPGVCYASSFQATSDKRLKFGFEDLSGESVLDAITPYRYGRLDKNLNERFVGVIAQDVEKVIPEAVRPDEYGYLSVDYGALTAVLWGEVKRLQKEIKEIKNGMQEKIMQESAKETVQEVEEQVEETALEKPKAKSSRRKVVK